MGMKAARAFLEAPDWLRVGNYPIKVWVTTTGALNGTDPTYTAGLGYLIIAVVTPQDV
jgi:hypothetical protein